MLFNSNEFLIFFCLVFVGYFLLAKRPGAQNVLILISSCVFYGTWSVLFLLLMLFTASMDYLFGLAMGPAKTGVQKRVLLVLSLCLNLATGWGFTQGWSTLVTRFNLWGHHPNRGTRSRGYQRSLVSQIWWNWIRTIIVAMPS